MELQSVKLKIPDASKNIGKWMSHWVIKLSAWTTSGFYGSVSAVEEVCAGVLEPGFAVSFRPFVWVSGSRSHPVERTQSGIKQPTKLLHPWNFPGKGTGVGYHCLLLLIPSSISNLIHCSFYLNNVNVRFFFNLPYIYFYSEYFKYSYYNYFNVLAC